MARDIRKWLEDLGLGKYVDTFIANDVDIDVLHDLDESDLERLGLSLGHRKKLLRAIADMEAAPTAVSKPAREVGKGSQLPPSVAERRQLTVMFCDLVGSTALSARLDPEDLREVIGIYHRCVADTVGAFDGFVAKYMGDGVLAYFGWPRAHEDDAERSVRSGLALIEAVGRLGHSAAENLQVRIGIGTGLVIVGDLIGSGDAQERGVVGETPNLAARLQTFAEPNTVVIAASTRRLVGNLFEYRDLGTIEAKGFAEPVPAWQVLRESGVENRFEALHSSSLTPLVGREEEIELLLDRWEQAKGGEGQVILLSGEAGIGKSRIAQTLHERLREERHRRLRYQCSHYHVNSALYPAIAQLESAAQLHPEDSPNRKLDKLEALLAKSGNAVREIAPIFASLLSISVGHRYPPLNLAPQQLKAKTLDTLVDYLVGPARHQPTLFVVEDAHWIDPTTKELLAETIERVRELHVLMMVTFRPEFAPTWGGHAHITALTLNRLSRVRCATMIDNLAGGKALPPEVREQILRKIDGVPLFVEELTKTVLESGLLRQAADRYLLPEPLPPLAIPSTLQDSLMARLDRLGPAKEVAQIGAVIGREFSYNLLVAVTLLHEGELNEALARLAIAELVFRRGEPPEAIYSFKHMLVQEAAYASLLRTKRQQLHMQIAEALTERFPETERQPELVAHHYTEAGLTEQAIVFWYKAGQLAIERSANAEAIAHLTKGLELLKRLPDTKSRDEQEIGLQIALGVPFIAAKGYSVPEVGRAYSRARELCLKLGDPPQLFPALWGLWIHHRARLEMGTAHALADQLVVLARRWKDSSLLLAAHHSQWSTNFGLGELTVACEHANDGLGLYSSEQHHAQAFVYGGHDPAVCAMSTTALALWMLGYPNRASVQAGKSLAMARELSHAPSVAYALAYMVLMHQFRREFTQMHECLEAMLHLGRELLLPGYLVTGDMLRGWADVFAEKGDTSESIASMRDGLIDRRYSVTTMTEPYFLCLLAEVYGRAGDAAEGLKTLEAALAFSAENATQLWQPELHRVKGELLLSLGLQDSELAFRQALQAAREQKAKSLELRAAMSLAHLWLHQGRGNEARELLAPIYGWFTEGFDTRDLQEAKALLEELR